MPEFSKIECCDSRNNFVEPENYLAEPNDYQFSSDEFFVNSESIPLNLDADFFDSALTSVDEEP